MLSTPAGPSRGQPSSSSRQRDRDPSRGAIGTATPRRAGTPPLPAYELPVAPLTEAGRQALQSLLRSQSLRLLKTHIRHAEAKITESAGEVNDRLADAKIKAQRRKERKDRERDASRSMTEAGDEEGNVDADDGVNEDVVRVRELGQSVEDVTRRLDETMRRAIDSGVRVDGLVDILGRLQEEVEASAGAARQQQRLRRRRRRGENDEDEEDGLYEATPEPEVDGEEISLRRKLEQRMAEDQAKWDDLTLTERYSKHNDYISFKRMVHDAKHPGEDTPPVPNPNTWFAHLEDPNASRKRRSSSSAAAPSRNTRHQVAHESTQDSDDGNDIAIERERISLKCPLTLLPFHDPVTSTKCPHSFERSAITDMIDRSAQTVPAAASSSGRGGRRIRAVKCPVCEVVLTNNDLREDPVLLRRVRRAEAARRRDEEDDEDGMSVSGRRKSGRGGIELGSDDEDGNGEEPMDVDPVRIKVERARSRGVSEFGDRSQDVRTESDTQDSNEDEREDDDEDDAE